MRPVTDTEDFIKRLESLRSTMSGRELTLLDSWIHNRRIGRSDVIPMMVLPKPNKVKGAPQEELVAADKWFKSQYYGLIHS